jgi:hypothetical protein
MVSRECLLGFAGFEPRKEAMVGGDIAAVSKSLLK